MPMILQVDGFQVVIYCNDHEPAHVHVIKASGEMRVELGDTITRTPTPISIVNMRNKDVKKGLLIVTAHQKLLLDRWKEIHD